MPWIHLRLAAPSKLFWKTPALAKLSSGPMVKLSVEDALSAYLILIVGKRVRPGRLIWAAAGVNDWLVFENAISRTNTTRCSNVRLEVNAVVLSSESVWPPAFIVCGNP